MKYLSDYIQESQTKLFQELQVFWAFSNEQFQVNCEKAGISKDDKLTHFGGGGYCPSKNADLLFERLSEIRKDGIKKDISENGIQKIIWRELSNHETELHGDLSDTIKALDGYGITEQQIQVEYEWYYDYRENRELYYERKKEELKKLRDSKDNSQKQIQDIER